MQVTKWKYILGMRELWDIMSGLRIHLRYGPLCFQDNEGTSNDFWSQSSCSHWERSQVSFYARGRNIGFLLNPRATWQYFQICPRSYMLLVRQQFFVLFSPRWPTEWWCKLGAQRGYPPLEQEMATVPCRCLPCHIYPGSHPARSCDHLCLLLSLCLSGPSTLMELLRAWGTLMADGCGHTCQCLSTASLV